MRRQIFKGLVWQTFYCDVQWRKSIHFHSNMITTRKNSPCRNCYELFEIGHKSNNNNQIKSNQITTNDEDGDGQLTKKQQRRRREGSNARTQFNRNNKQPAPAKHGRCLAHNKFELL